MSAKPLIVLESRDLKIPDLSEIADVFAEYTENSDLLLLSGKVGVGKTEFARLIIRGKAKKENFDIIGNSNSEVKNYILNKIQ